MTTSTIESSWHNIQTATTALRSAADVGEWINVMEMAAVRHQQVLDHFAAFPVGPNTSNFYRERLNTMLNSEQELQDLTLAARKQLMRSALTTNKNHRAVDAYLNTATR